MNEDALARIHEIASLACFARDGKVFNKAIEALEKQIPKQPLEEYRRGVFQRMICPRCESIFGVRKNNQWCPDCGQRLDWREYDDE